MPSRQPLRDYLDVSRTRVQRLAAALPDKVARRLTAASLQLGKIGGGVTLGPDARDEFIRMIADVEHAVRADYTVRSINDRELTVGHWVESRRILMAYGVPQWSSDPVGAALFTSIEMQNRVLLVGSSSQLLDRMHPAAEDPGGMMSNPQSIEGLLQIARSDTPGAGTASASDAWARHGYPIANLHRVMSESSPPQPVQFLAVVIQTSQDDQGWSNIIAHPLYVAAAAPD